MKKERLAKYEARVKVIGDEGDEVPEFRIRPSGNGVRGGSWRLTRMREGRCTTQSIEVRQHPVDGAFECSCLTWLRWARCVHVEFMGLLVSGHTHLEAPSIPETGPASGPETGPASGPETGPASGPETGPEVHPEVRGSDECLRV